VIVRQDRGFRDWRRFIGRSDYGLRKEMRSDSKSY